MKINEAAAKKENKTPVVISNRKKWLFIGVVTLAIIFLVEGMAYYSIQVLQDKWSFYKIPERPKQANKNFKYSDYLVKRDPVLGWPSPQEYGDGNYTVDGAIPVPANQMLSDKEWLVTLYGDSFTKATTSAVNSDQAWPNLLAIKIGGRIKNFGVGGYGSDQSYIRFLERGENHSSPIVMLGHQAENIIRNLTRYRDFTNYAQWYAFKPRFDIDSSGNLARIPIPNLSENEYSRLIGLSKPLLSMEHENFGPMGRAGAVLPKFPYVVSLIRNFGYWRFRSKLTGLPDHLPFYDSKHPFRGLAITEMILKAFHNEAVARGQKPLVILFPGPGDTKHLEKTGHDVFHELSTRLKESGVEVLNLNPMVLEFSRIHHGFPLYQDHHFGPELNKETAHWIQSKLIQLKWIKTE